MKTRAVEVGSRRDAQENFADSYLDETDFPGFEFDPAADRLRLGDDWAFHPLADTSLVHYRYSPGDTLRIRLPAKDRSIVLYEVLVEPRRADFELVAGSLWLDSASASLVRATYRPARPWNLRLDGRGDADVPGFIGPIEAEIHYITIESSLQELEYWLPRRFAFQGEARAGGLFRMPMTLEWSVGGYVVNEAPFDILVEGELPEGWQRDVTTETDDDGNETTYTIILPTSRELRESPALSQDFGQRSPISFSQDEVDELASELQGLLPTYRRFRPRLAWGLEQGQVRYNRVEGVSVGASTIVPLRPDQGADGRLSVSHPLVLGLAGALEVGTGTSWGALPVQRSFFLGSSRTLRAFDANGYFGRTFWRGRAEIATDFAAARLSAFGDLGWVGARSSFRLDDPLASVGIGTSFLDGIVRFDVARAVRGSDRWKLHLYLDGLL